jgi:hypothetical protein
MPNLDFAELVRLISYARRPFGDGCGILRRAEEGGARFTPSGRRRMR